MAGELDAELWSRLPSELMDLVLRRLPIAGLCKFRAVCKHWSTLPTVSAEDPYFLCVPFRSFEVPDFHLCKLYSFTRNQWEDLDFSFLAPHWLGGTAPTREIRLNNSCSDGGLLCLSGVIIDDVEKGFLLVCNPLTGATKFLPSLDPDVTWNYLLHAEIPVEFPARTEDYLMHRDPSSGAYKIFVVQVELRVQLHYYMYDSNIESWEEILTLKRDDVSMKNLRSCSIVFNGVYFCVCGGGIHAYELSAYNMSEGKLLAAGVKTELDSNIRSVSFVVRNDCLLLLAKTRRNRTRVYRIDEMKLSRLHGSEGMKLPGKLDWTEAFAYRDSILFLKEVQREFTVVDIGDSQAVKTRFVPMFPTRSRALYPISGKATFNLHATV